MKKIETTKTEVIYKCDFCEFNSDTSRWVEAHEKQKHTCTHEGFIYEYSTDDYGVTSTKLCKECLLQIGHISDFALSKLSDEDKQKIWDIFVKYKA